MNFPCGIACIGFLQIKDDKGFQEEKDNYKKEDFFQGFVWQLEILITMILCVHEIRERNYELLQDHDDNPLVP